MNTLSYARLAARWTKETKTKLKGASKVWIRLLPSGGSCREFNRITTDVRHNLDNSRTLIKDSYFKKLLNSRTVAPNK